MLRIPLVSPHTSPVQVQRGIVMLATYMSHNHHGMGYGNSAGAGAMVRLLMYGVYDANGLVTADGNHLVVTAKLSTDAGEQDVSIDQTFSIVAGRAYVFAPISLPDISEDAPLEILGISIEDSSGTPFAVPGVVLLAPEPSPTPDAGACTADAECDDGDSDTVDTCTAGQCQHREQGGGMGPGMGPGSGPMM